MIDQHDGTVEPNWQACRLRRDYVAVSFSDPPVDATIGITVAVLHPDKIKKANTEAAIAVYLILRRGSARSDAIMAAAKAMLDKKDQELISAVLTVHKSVEAERNSLAHSCWGTCNTIPDAVLWVDLADNANFIADYFSKEPGKSRTFSGREHADFAKKLFYYTLDDLEDVNKQIYKAEKMIFTLVRYLRLSENPPDGRAREDIYDQLCNLAPIRGSPSCHARSRSEK